MSRSVKIVEIVNGRESLGGGSLSFLEVGLRRTPERVCASCPGTNSLGLTVEKTDPEREGEWNRCGIWEIFGKFVRRGYVSEGCGMRMHNLLVHSSVKC